MAEYSKQKIIHLSSLSFGRTRLFTNGMKSPKYITTMPPNTAIREAVVPKMQFWIKLLGLEPLTPFHGTGRELGHKKEHAPSKVSEMVLSRLPGELNAVYSPASL